MACSSCGKNKNQIQPLNITKVVKVVKPVSLNGLKIKDAKP